MALLVYLFSLLQFLTGSDDVSLVFAGDAMQHDRQIAAARGKQDVFNYDACFKNVETYVRSADYAVVNLECALGGKPYTGYPCFSAPDAYAAALWRCGFDLFLHANNHCLDRRDAGLRRTLNVLDTLGVPHIGTYRNAEERRKQLPFITDIKGLKVAFLNYTYGTNGIVVQKDVVVDYINRQTMRSDIRKAREIGAELVVVCVHWGVEYKLVQNREQESLAAFLEEEGVDLIIGGHPHVIQPMEIRHNEKWNKDVLVVYSLGNFISAMRTDDTRGGAMVKVVVGKKDGKPCLKGASYKLVYVQEPERGGNYELVPADKMHLLREDSKLKFMRFVENARRVFGKYNKGVEEDFEVPLLQPSRIAFDYEFIE